MSALLLDRPVVEVLVSANPLASDAWRETLAVLRKRLESWLAVEEERLSLAREHNFSMRERESEWQDMLGLYERLCTGLAPSGLPSTVSL